MSIQEFYNAKKILITGVTGFVGKVLLEKILWSLPSVDKIYILIRNKKGSNLNERFKKEIFGSPCFDRLRVRHKEAFEPWFLEKVKPIAGDLLKDRIALSEADESFVINSINLIIHSAASVDFNARLDEALNINTLGTLRMYSLAKRCKILENFLHVSTAYVNSNQPGGWIEEEIFSTEVDPEKLLENLIKTPVEQLVANIHNILGKYPNTYTFTKALTERIINKEKGKYCVTILRPTIIGCSWKEPFLGWVDTVSAAGALYLLGGLGLLNCAEGNKQNIGDQVPVDFVTNGILCAAFYYANQKGVHVLHSGTSDKNPVTWSLSTNVVRKFWRENPSSKCLKRPEFELIDSRLRLQVKLLKERIPAYIYSWVAHNFGGPTMKKNANKLIKMLSRAKEIGEIFRHFTTNEWIFSTKNLTDISKTLSKEEREIFFLDVTEVDWVPFLLHFAWGLKKFVLKEEVDTPANVKRLDVLSRQNNEDKYFLDMDWALTHGKSFQPPSSNVMMKKVLGSEKVRRVIDKDPKKNLAKAQDICSTMFAEYNMKIVRIFAWGLHKTFKRIYEKIVIDENQIKKLKELEMKGPLVLAPNHVSYVDFLVISYIFYHYGLKCPHVNSHEDFLNLKFVTKILRASGAFFIRKKAKTYDELYNAIITEYLNVLLQENCNLEMFIEISRSRSGKLTGPSNEVFDIFLKSYLKGEISTKNLHIVPISINFERVIEGETFPFELLGEEKVKESFSRIVSSVKILSKNFGRIFIEFCEPINVIAYKSQSESIETNVENLKQKILYELNEKSVVMPTNIIASILLMHRKGVTEELLISRSEWVANELIKRGKKIGSYAENTHQIPVRNAIKLLDKIIVRKKDMFGLSVTPKVDYKNILLLSYYRNALLNTFANEAFMACALVAFGHHIAWKEGIEKPRLLEEYLFLSDLLAKEFIFTGNANDVLNKMCQFQVIKEENNKIKVNNDIMIGYLCSLIWPFVETYWVSVVYLFSLKNQTEGTRAKKLIQQIQWFAESMHEERIVEFYETCSQDTIKKALKTFKSKGLLTKNPASKMVKLNAPEEQLHDLENHLNKFMKNSYAKSVDSPIDIARKSVLVDFPFMAKLSKL